jgi:peptide/nickel transport system permease protein
MRNARRIVPLVLGILLLLLFLLMAFAPTLFTEYGQKEMFRPWQNPNEEHLLGTNAMGYDVFTEIVYGTKETLFVGVISSILTMLLGTFISIASTGKGILGSLFNGIVNVFALMPKLITLIVLATFIGSSHWNLICLIAAFSWVGIARNVRAKVIHLNSQPFIENCIIQGYSRFHIVTHHVIPNLYDVLLSRFLLGVNSCIMMESTLSFLGFGDLYHPTWGTMINFAYKRGAFIRQAYHYLLTPGICIMLLSLSFYLISLYIDGRKNTIQEA